MSLTELCVRRPVLAWMIMAATIVFGAVALGRIGISEYPDVDHPVISVGLAWEGAAPEAMESDVVEQVEEALSQVEGIRTISSEARLGSANITIELDLSRNVDLAMQDVQARVAQAARRLPREMDPPVVSKTNPEDQPIMFVGLSGPFSPQVLADTSRYLIKEKLQTILGVGEVFMGGFPERNVRVWIDAERLEGRGLTVQDVLGALQRQHVELPAGRIEAEGREITVRVLGEALDLATLRNMVIKEVNGVAIQLADVALVEDGFEDVRRYTRVNGQPAQGMGIKKQRGSNAVAVAKAVRVAIDELRPNLRPGMELGINFDSTVFVEESVKELQFEVGLSIFLTALVCWLFLGSFSATLNVILAIPMSLMGTIAAIYFLGFTLNTFTLLALALAVGIVVDDAIMILENIHRHRDMGKDAIRAAIDGTNEIKFAALAATMAVVAIFLPVVFMKGVVGRFFLEFGITFCIAVVLSYLEAITLAPARAARLMAQPNEHARAGLGRFAEGAFDLVTKAYGRALGPTLRRRGAVLLASVVVLGGAYWVFGGLKREFVPSQDQGRIMLKLQTAVGADLKETDRVLRQAEEFALSRPEVQRLFMVIGSFRDGAVNSGMMFVTLKPPNQRMNANAFAALLRNQFNGYPGLKAIVQDMSQRGFSASRGFPVEFSLRGPEWDMLTEQSRNFADKLTASGKVVDVDTDYRLGMPELRIEPDRARTADVGVSMEDVAASINTLVGGVRAGKYTSRGRRIDLRLRLLAEQRSRPEDINRLKVRTNNGTLIPLSSLVKLKERPALQGITRKDRERAVSVFGNVAPGSSQSEALAEVAKYAKDLPPGYRLVAGGQTQTFQDSMGGLVFALLLGVVVAYMILAAQFNSLLHPVTVLTILPLSVAGAVFALVIGGITINLFSMIGLLLLMGIVKKNSIILVDYANQVRDEAPPDKPMGPVEAMRTAAPVRLRPILMTSMATIMAAVPATLALGPGSETRLPMAVAVIGGIVLSTPLSLFVVPAFYAAVTRKHKHSVHAEQANT